MSKFIEDFNPNSELQIVSKEGSWSNVRWLGIVSIVSFFIGVVVNESTHKKSTKHVVSNNIDSTECAPPITKDSLTLDYNCIYGLLQKHHVKFSYIVLGQIYWESSNLKYWPRLKDNNLLGMRVPATRYTFATNYWDYNSFAKFKDIEDCIRDYKSWQVQNAYHIHSESEYLSLLDRVYDFEDHGYSVKVKEASNAVLSKIKK